MPRIGRYTGGGDTDLGVIAAGSMRVFVCNVMPEDGWGTGMGWRAGRHTATNSTATGVVFWAPNQQPSTRLGMTDPQSMTTVMTSGSEGATYTKVFTETSQAYSPIDSALKMPEGRTHAIGLFVSAGTGDAGHGMIAYDKMSPAPTNGTFYDDQGISSVPEEFDIDATQIAGWMTVWIDYIKNRAPTCTADTPAGNTATPIISGTFSDADEVYGDRITQYQLRVTRVSNSQVVWNPDWVNASPADQSSDTFQNTYAGTALVAGQQYKVDCRVADEFGENSAWSTAKTWTYSATGTVTMSGSIAGKQTTLTPGPFGFRWTHAAALSTNAVRIQILDGNTVVRQSGTIVKTVASSAAPGTLSSITWAETGFAALTTGKVYSYRIDGRDSGNIWSGYATNPITFTTNAAPGKPTALSPGGSVYISSLPILASFSMTDPDDSPGAGLNSTLEITRPDLSVVTVTPTYNSGSQRWEYSLTSTQITAAGTYSMRAKGTDAAQSGPWSDTVQWYYATGGTVTITSPGSGSTVTTGTPTFTWTFSGTQVSWRVFVYNALTFVLEYDTGYVSNTNTSHLMPLEYPLDEGSWTVYIEVVDNVGTTSGSSGRTFTVDLPSATALASVQLSPYRGNMDPGDSGVLVRWAASGISQANFVQYIIERKAVNESDDPYGRITVAKITEVAETVWIDYYALDDVEYIYYVRQDYKSGSDTIRSAAMTAQISIRLKGMSIGSVSDPELRLGSRYWDQREITRVFNRTVQVPWGAKLPTVLADPTNYKRVRIRMRFMDDDQYKALDYMEMLGEMADSGDILCYRDPKRRKVFGMITDFGETDERGGIIGVSVELVQVNFREEVPKGIGMGAEPMPTKIPRLRKIGAATNLSLNPSLEASQSQWTIGTLGTGITATGGNFVRSNVAAYVGSWHWRIIVTANSAPANGTVSSVIDGGSVGGHIPGIVAGKTYTAAAMFSSSSPDFGYRVVINWYTGAGALISFTESSTNPSYSLSSQYKQRSATGVAPSGATNCTVIYTVYSKTAGTLGTVDIDGSMTSEGQITGYFDGSFANCYWTGTAHLSSSNRQPYEVPLFLTKRGLILMEPVVRLSDAKNSAGNDITDAFIGGSVDMDYSREIKTQCRLQLTDPDILDPYVDRIALFLRLSYPDGSTTLTQLGLFLVQPPKKTIRPVQTEAEYEGFDMTYNLRQRIPGKTIQFNGGTNIMQAVRDRLDALGYPRHEIPSDSEVFPSRGWRRPPSSDMNDLKIINDMLASAGYYQLWATPTGRLKSLAYTSRKIRSSVKTYTGGEDGAVVEPFTSNLLTTPINRVVVTREVDGVTYRGEARIDNPADPHSIPRIGEKTEFITDDKVASSAAATKLANEKLDDLGGLDLECELKTFPEPWHTVHEVYTLDLKDVNGKAIPDMTGRYWCKSWTLALTATDGLMTHKLQRIVQLEDI